MTLYNIYMYIIQLKLFYVTECRVDVLTLCLRFASSRWRADAMLDADVRRAEVFNIIRKTASVYYDAAMYILKDADYTVKINDLKSDQIWSDLLRVYFGLLAKRAWYDVTSLAKRARRGNLNE